MERVVQGQIPELLILILHHLDLPDLLISIGVSHTWKNVIDSTKTLQQALFFVPVYQRPNLGNGSSSTATFTPNPFLDKNFETFFDQAGHRVCEELAANSWSRLDMTSTMPIDHHEDIAVNRVAQAYLRPEASWRRMCPCSPAPTNFYKIEEEWRPDGCATQIYRITCPTHLDGHNGRNIVDRSVRKDNHLTMGLLYDTVEQLVFWKSDYSLFSFIWPWHSKPLESAKESLRAEWLHRESMLDTYTNTEALAECGFDIQFKASDFMAVRFEIAPAYWSTEEGLREDGEQGLADELEEKNEGPWISHYRSASCGKGSEWEDLNPDGVLRVSGSHRFELITAPFLMPRD